MSKYYTIMLPSSNRNNHHNAYKGRYLNTPLYLHIVYPPKERKKEGRELTHVRCVYSTTSVQQLRVASFSASLLCVYLH
jgi:hypothetical protein